MKKLILLLFIPLVFTCSDDTSDDNTNSIDDNNPLYLDTNGVTIKAKDWAIWGEAGTINGITYVIVDAATLRNMIENGDDVSRVCTSRIIEMNDLIPHDFNQDISSWDVSNVTNMNDMFSGTIDFNQDISSWDVSNVTKMGGMFSDSQFNGNISSWDVSNVTNMAGMFMSSQFNQPIGDWNVSNVTDMSLMFYGTVPFNQDLSSWDVENVTYCLCFLSYITNWTEPKPNFSNCFDGDIGC